MKLKQFFAFLFIGSLLFSCQEKEPIINDENLLLGNWSNAVYHQDTLTLDRVSELPNEAYGFSFLEDNNFLERTFGFCATPPLTFFGREGNWYLEEDNLKIYDKNIVDVIGAEPILWYNFKIVELSETKLVLTRQLTEQETDHQHLMDLFNEIEEITYSISCTDNADWNFTPYGSQACGGPQGYIPYSNQIDVDNFLELVEEYTQVEHEYNVKWGIISPCNLLAQPSNIECQNGSPVLIY